MISLRNSKRAVVALATAVALVHLGPLARSALAQPTPDPWHAEQGVPEARLGPSATDRRIPPTKPERSTVGRGEDPRKVVLKFVEGSDVELRAGRFVSPSGRFGTDVVNRVMAAFGAVPERAFTQSREELERLASEAERRSGRDLADFNLYFDLAVPIGADAAALIDQLNAEGVVELADASAVGELPAPTPDFEPQQEYTDPAPGGVDSDYAQTVPGGNGAGVRIVDIEGGWNLDHEDLGLPASALIEGKQCSATNWWQHGTAVLGEMVAKDNGFGVTGIVPAASARASSVFQANNCMSYDGVQAVMTAITHLQNDGVPGAVILIEQHTTACASIGYLPMECNQAWFDAFDLAALLGIVVVEAGGNGGNDLDAYTQNGQPIFDRNFRDSQAIMVGAGCSPTANSCQDRTALDFSNYGSRVDVQGWGHNVTTTGYGGLFADGDDRFYTATFNGTSSASPIVTGAAAAVQGVHLAKLGTTMSPGGVRSLLTNTGTPQPQADAAQRPIGPRPNLKDAIFSVLIWNVIGPWVAFDPSPYIYKGCPEPGPEPFRRVAEMACKVAPRDLSVQGLLDGLGERTSVDHATIDETDVGTKALG